MNFIFDLDGTICFKGQPISANILDLLLELERAGHRVGFASARPCRDMMPVLDERFNNHLLIGANGAMTYYRGEPLGFTPLPAALAEEIIRVLNDAQAEYLIDDKWNYAHNLKSHHPLLLHVDPLQSASRVSLEQIESFIKIVVLSCPDFEQLSETMKGLDVTIHHHSTEGILDITYKGVNKMSALEQFGQYSEKFICFGNDMNDLPLFQKAFHSVLIGNYEPLLHIAKEQIMLDDQIEKNIVSKLRELHSLYA
ncbi:HAD family hydrolase [Paenibacillus sp. DMB20]|uniref:HAD-IIB family hydrolase n=1 Tax=Paenibacillus sp. DMB20 TaxID=1642570 RepID=UPI0006274EE3|nr:HAD family hydrolase [Paenibacillus sp. DMB20]KKO52405.1 hydrolase [Paenibacillus sp. DMB20]